MDPKCGVRGDAQVCGLGAAEFTGEATDVLRPVATTSYGTALLRLGIMPSSSGSARARRGA